MTKNFAGQIGYFISHDVTFPNPMIPFHRKNGETFWWGNETATAVGERDF